MSNSERRKGTSGELEVRDLFRAGGFDCDRTPNSGALRITGDLYGSVPAHLEVKRQEVARPWQWFEQAQAEAPAGVMPVVAFRRSRSPWLAIVPLEALVALMAAAATASGELLDRVSVFDTNEDRGVWVELDGERRCVGHEATVASVLRAARELERELEERES